MDTNYSDPKLMHELDVISELFPKEKLEDMINYADYLFKRTIDATSQSSNDTPIIAETHTERVYELLLLASYYLQSFDPLIFAKNAIAQLDLNKLYLDATISADNPKDGKTGFEDLLEDGEYLNQLMSILKYDDKQQQQFVEMVSSHQGVEEFLSKIKKDEFVTRLILTYANAASLKKQNNTLAASTLYHPMLFAHVSKLFYKQFSDEYKMWESCVCMRDFEQIVGCNALYYCQFSQAESEFKDELSAKGMILSLFIYYFGLYSKFSPKYLYEFKLGQLLTSPVQIARFVNFLKEHEYSKVFVDGYSDYCKANDVSPLFDVSSINGVTKDPKWDEDPEHSSCFEKIPTLSDIGTLERKLILLYEELVKEGFLTNDTQPELFVYRLSGILPFYPMPNETSGGDKYYIKWNSTLGALAYLVNKLYRNNRTGAPKFKQIGMFFIPRYSNGSAQYNIKKDIKEIIDKIISDIKLK